VIANATKYPLYNYVIAGSGASSASRANSSFFGNATQATLNCESAVLFASGNGSYDRPANLGGLFSQDPSGIRALTYAANDTAWSEAASIAIAAATPPLNSPSSFPLVNHGLYNSLFIADDGGIRRVTIFRQNVRGLPVGSLSNISTVTGGAAGFVLNENRWALLQGALLI